MAGRLTGYNRMAVLHHRRLMRDFNASAASRNLARGLFTILDTQGNWAEFHVESLAIVSTRGGCARALPAARIINSC